MTPDRQRGHCPQSLNRVRLAAVRWGPSDADWGSGAGAGSHPGRLPSRRRPRRRCWLPVLRSLSCLTLCDTRPGARYLAVVFTRFSRQVASPQRDGEVIACAFGTPRLVLPSASSSVERASWPSSVSDDLAQRVERRLGLGPVRVVRIGLDEAHDPRAVYHKA